MRVLDEFGISVAKVDVEEALTTDWATFAEPVDVVRVEDPERSSWADLTAVGFLPKPEWITWLGRPAKDVDEFIARLSKKERKNVRAAFRRVDAAGLRTVLREPLTEDGLDTFLGLYDKQVAEMTYGLPMARMQRESLLADGDSYIVVLIYEADDLVAGCVCHRSAKEDALRLRFSAVDEVWRSAGLARVLRVRLAVLAHARGYGSFSLGNDPNLYGHVVKPGLFEFKSHLGFLPLPSQAVRIGAGRDVADRVLSLKSLTDPAFVLSYSDTSDRGLAGVVLSTSADVDLAPYRAAFLARTTLVTLSAD